MTISPTPGRWRRATWYVQTLALGLTLPFQPGCMCGCSAGKAEARACRAGDCLHCPAAADRDDAPPAKR